MRRIFRRHLGSSVMNQQLQIFCDRPQRGITLAEMMEVGRASDMERSLIENAQMLHTELPVRLARRINELQKMPYGLSEFPPVRKVQKWYERSFNDLVSMRMPQTPAEEHKFTECLEKILQRHSAVVPTMSQGILMLKEQMGNEEVSQCPFLQDFLDRFFLSRIGVRMLLSQHVAMHEPAPGFIGILGEAVCPGEEAKGAVAHASQICEAKYGIAPEVIVRGDVRERIPYVPGHLHHMLHELLKNAMRAVVERHAPAAVVNHDNGGHTRSPSLDFYPSQEELPEIELTVAAGETDFHIRISDQGGGIPRDQMANIWNYMYTTAERPKEADMEMKGGIRNAPMAGFGYGLPLSKLYARYFGGDINVVSMEGYGTHAYLYLSRLGNTKEPLPH